MNHLAGKIATQATARLGGRAQSHLQSFLVESASRGLDLCLLVFFLPASSTTTSWCSTCERRWTDQFTMALRLCVLLCAAQLSLAASLHDRAKGHQDWLQHVRRTLHKHPETGFEEFETSRMLRDWLSELNVTFTCALRRCLRTTYTPDLASTA